MKKSKIHNRLFDFIIILLCIFVIILITYFSQNCNFLFGDDGYFSLYWSNDESFFSCFNFSIHGGGYIGLFLTKFLCFGLPNMLCIHPADFISVPHGIIKGVLTSFILILITNFCSFFKMSKKLYLLIFSTIIVLFFKFFTESSIIMSNYNFYRYFFSLLFLSIFLNYILKNILVKRNKISYKNLILASVSGFVAGTSIEINIFSLLTFVSLIYIYYVIVNKFFKGKNIFKSLKINLDKNFYIPSFFLILAVLLVTSSKIGFQQMAAQRGLGGTLITTSLLKNFVSDYFNLYFMQNIFFWLFIAVLFICALVFAVRKNEIRKIIFPPLFIISVITVYFSLVLLGKTGYDGNFWFFHNNLIFLFKMLMIYPSLYLLSYLYSKSLTVKYIKSKKLKIVLFILFIICMYKPFYNVIDFNIKLNRQILDYMYGYKRKAYMVEKILRFYYIKNKRPILPQKAILSHDCDPWRFLGEGNYNNYFIGNIMTSSYYPRIYKDKKSIDMGYELSDDAVKIFYKLGGTFSKEELENIKFSRLLNDDFVLNKDFSQTEIKNIIEQVLN